MSSRLVWGLLVWGSSPRVAYLSHAIAPRRHAAMHSAVCRTWLGLGLGFGLGLGLGFGFGFGLAMHSAVCRTSPKPRLRTAVSSCLSHLGEG